MGDLEQTLALLVGEIAGQREVDLHPVDGAVVRFAGLAVFRVNFLVSQADGHIFERPLLAIGVHSQSDRRTGSQRGQQQVVGGGAGVLTTHGVRFVGGEVMVSGGDAECVEGAEFPQDDAAFFRSRDAGIGSGVGLVRNVSGDPRTEGVGNEFGVARVCEQVVRLVERDEALGVFGRLVDRPGVLDADDVVDRPSGRASAVF